MRRLKQILNNEDGASAIEYGLLAALIALPAALGFSRLGDILGNTFTDLANTMLNAI